MSIKNPDTTKKAYGLLAGDPESVMFASPIKRLRMVIRKPVEKRENGHVVRVDSGAYVEFANGFCNADNTNLLLLDDGTKCTEAQFLAEMARRREAMGDDIQVFLVNEEEPMPDMKKESRMNVFDAFMSMSPEELKNLFSDDEKKALNIRHNTSQANLVVLAMQGRKEVPLAVLERIESSNT